MLGGGSGFGNHFAPVIVAAGAADVVGKLGFATVRAFDMTDGLEGMMRTTHVATRLGGLLLRDSHFNYSLPEANSERRLS
jgi:hypothetical protein